MLYPQNGDRIVAIDFVTSPPYVGPIAVRKVASPLRELTCHTGSHSVTCRPAEVTFPPLPQPKLVLLSDPGGYKAELI